MAIAPPSQDSHFVRLDRILFASSRAEAAAAGFDDAEWYLELSLPMAARRLPMQQLLREEGGGCVGAVEKHAQQD